jgi:hypothetical protein
MKVQKGAPYDSINPRLNRASEASAAAQETARKQGRRLPKEKLMAVVETTLHLAPVVEQQITDAIVAQHAHVNTFESLYHE